MKYTLQSLQLFGLIANVVPLVLAIIYYTQGGDNWGGKLPILVNVSLIFMMICGIIGLGVMGRVFYMLNVNWKHYSGNKGSIRAILFVALLYFITILLGGISISKYTPSSSNSCSHQAILELWEEDVYESGIQSYKNFCHQCQCYISQDNINHYTPSQLSSLNYSTNNGAQDISKCKPEEGQLVTSEFDKLKTMEKTYKCAGFCSPNLTFTFLGTSSGIPAIETGCFSQVQGEFSKMRIGILSANITMFVFMVVCFGVSLYLRKKRLKEIAEEYGLRLYEPINSISVIGVSHDDWRVPADYISQSDQQKSSNSRNNNYYHNVTTSHKPNQSDNDNCSVFGQSQLLEKQDRDVKIQHINDENTINKMKSVRKAFRSMHHHPSTFKK